MTRTASLAFSILAYLLTSIVMLYAMGFLGNFLVPTCLDAPSISEISPNTILIDLLLLSAFALQHSIMARPFFKRWLTKYFPAAVERSIYIMVSNLLMVLLFVFWQPFGGAIWNVSHEGWRSGIYLVYALGWVIMIVSTCVIDHFDLFGLRQAWTYFRGLPYVAPEFREPWPYRVVRHPMYVGWLMTFWAAPTMTLGHLMFSVVMTAYILIAIRLEERDLIDRHGDAYRAYRDKVPMLIPQFW